MTKFFALVAVFALTACASGENTEAAATDSTTVAVDSTSAVTVESTTVADTAK